MDEFILQDEASQSTLESKGEESEINLSQFNIQ